MESRTTAPVPMTDWFPATGDPAIIGRIVIVKRINVPESKKQQKEVYIELPAVEHKAAGIQGDVSFALIKEEADPNNANYWKRRFSAAWDAYKGTKGDVPQGTPLEEFDELPEGIAKVLKSRDIATVEQLSVISDATCEALGGGMRKYRTAAQRFVKRRMNHGFGYQING